MNFHYIDNEKIISYLGVEWQWTRSYPNALIRAGAKRDCSGVRVTLFKVEGGLWFIISELCVSLAVNDLDRGGFWSIHRSPTVVAWRVISPTHTDSLVGQIVSNARPFWPFHFCDVFNFPTEPPWQCQYLLSGGEKKKYGCMWILCPPPAVSTITGPPC